MRHGEIYPFRSHRSMAEVMAREAEIERAAVLRRQRSILRERQAINRAHQEGEIERRRNAEASDRLGAALRASKEAGNG